MLSRFITRPSSHLRLLTLFSPINHFSTPKPHPLSSPQPPFSNPNSNFSTRRFFSTNRNNNGDDGENYHCTPKIDLWKISNEEAEESVFEEDAGTLDGISSGSDAKPPASTKEEESWLSSPAAYGGDAEDDIFKGVEKEVEGSKSDEWSTVDGPWRLGGEEDKVDDVFGIGDGEKVDYDDIRGDDLEMRVDDEGVKIGIMKPNYVL